MGGKSNEIEECWDALKDCELEVSKLRKENFWLKKKLQLIRSILDRKLE